MKFIHFIKKSISVILLISLTLTLSSCTKKKGVYTKETAVFTEKENGNLVSTSGVEYSLLATEGALYYLGDLVFQGGVEGDLITPDHLDFFYQTGLFSIENSEADDILVRRDPDSEWFSIYRKTSLPPSDFSVDNCSRLELVLGISNTTDDAVHTTCGEGISDKSEIANFLSDVRSQKTPREAGIYELVTKPDGFFENSYIYAVIYGFFENEQNIAVCMPVTSYNDLAYAISIEEKDYVLPKEWLEKLQNS